MNTSNDMDERRFLQALFAVSVALVLLLSMLPAIAQAPDQVIIKPLAECKDGKCTMTEKDFRTLQTFHAERLGVLKEAGELIDHLNAQIAELMRVIKRYAMGCETRQI